MRNLRVPVAIAILLLIGYVTALEWGKQPTEKVTNSCGLCKKKCLSINNTFFLSYVSTLNVISHRKRVKLCQEKVIAFDSQWIKYLFLDREIIHILCQGPRK